jgi:ferredoxin--NADP+ reductase
MQVGTGDMVEGEYVVGWAKRGPSGVIGTNKPDSVATVKAMIEDIPSLSGIDDAHRDPVQIEKLLAERNIQYVTYDGWQTLNQFEVARGEEQGRPRIKLTRVPEMLQVCQES